MSFQLDDRLALLGAGKMGGAMLAGWLAAGLDPAAVAVFDPAPPDDSARLIARHRLALNPPVETLNDVAVVVIAVKPQVLEQAVAPLVRLARHRPLILSIAAGKTIATLERLFGAGSGVVRAIPNTPAAIGRGISAFAANAHVSQAQRGLAVRLLEAVGEVVEVASEQLIDVATAVSGSGPAYVFHLVECLAAAGVEAGLPGEVAMKLARETVAGAGELMRQSGTEAAVLRENVTSPNGTTHAALQVLMGEDGLEALMRRAVAAAARRSRELAS